MLKKKKPSRPAALKCPRRGYTQTPTVRYTHTILKDAGEERNKKRISLRCILCCLLVFYCLVGKQTCDSSADIFFHFLLLFTVKKESLKIKKISAAKCVVVVYLPRHKGKCVTFYVAEISKGLKKYLPSSRFILWRNGRVETSKDWCFSSALRFK